MKINISTQIALCVLSLLVGCFPVAQPATPEGVHATTAPIPTEGKTSEEASQAELPDALPTEPSSKPAAPETPNTVSENELSQVARLALQFSSRYLEAKGETLQLQVQLLDAEGNPLRLGEVPLEYKSSRPEDFQVSDTGLITALVDYGYSDIVVRLGELQSRELFSVNAGGGSAGGGTGSSNASTGPTQENIRGVVEFQF